MKREDLIGKTFGRLTVLGFGGVNSNHKSTWKVLCECGKEAVLLGASMKNGRTTSCGCFKREESSKSWTTHGFGSVGKRTRSYTTWVGMRERCNNPNHAAYKHYGGRGITVCERWDDFLTFLEDMGNKPVGMEIDRIDVNGNYEPSNCRWATDEEQANNTRKNRFVTINGLTKSHSQWARFIGITHDSFSNRVDQGWPEENLLLPPSPGLNGKNRSHA